MFWFHQDLERLENQIQELEYDPKLIFYGSSTFTLWNELTTIYKKHNPLNLNASLSFSGASVSLLLVFSI